MPKRKAIAARTARGHFAPGTSGNAGGRPKALPELREAARLHTPAALLVLSGIMRNKKASPSARVAAVRELLDRAWGRPAQELDIQGSLIGINADLPGDTFATMNSQQKIQFAARIAYILQVGANEAERSAR